MELNQLPKDVTEFLSRVDASSEPYLMMIKHCYAEDQLRKKIDLGFLDHATEWNVFCLSENYALVVVNCSASNIYLASSTMAPHPSASASLHHIGIIKHDVEDELSNTVKLCYNYVNALSQAHEQESIFEVKHASEFPVAGRGLFGWFKQFMPSLSRQ